MILAAPILAALGLAILAAPAFSQNIIYVDQSASGAADGTSWMDAHVELRDALAGAADLPGLERVEIWIAAGTYTPEPANGNRNAPFPIYRGWELYGGFIGGELNRSDRDPALNTTILSGDLNGDDGSDFANNADNSLHVVWTVGADSGTRILDGLTITAGNADGPSFGGMGAGLIDFGEAPRVTNCVIEKNFAALDGGGVFVQSNARFTDCAVRENRCGARGGGAFNNWSRPVWTDCVVANNLAQGFGGGGVYSDHGGPTFQRCEFRDNWADGSLANGYGGAMIVTASNTSISDCLFEGNNAFALGGAMLIQQDSPLLITDCVFDGSAGSSGAVTILDSPPVFVRCRFMNNDGQGRGAVDNSNGATPLFLNCEFLGNRAVGTAGDGGAVRVSSGEVTLFGCLLSGNSAARNGGGIAVYTNGILCVINSTIANNSAVAQGGGIYSMNGLPTISIESSILWDNNHAFAQGQRAQLNSPDMSVFEVDYSCVKGWTGTLGGVGNFAGDPFLVDPLGNDGSAGTEDDDYSLLPGSPCIDAGDNDAVPRDSLDLDGDLDTAEKIPYDIAGSARFVDDPDVQDLGNGTAPLVDIGAAEFIPLVTDVAELSEGFLDSPPPADPDLAAYPNPFNPSTTIRYTLREAAAVRLTIHDSVGRLVHTLDAGYRSAGDHRATWDGRNGAGAPVGSGRYFIRLDCGDHQAGESLMLIR